MAGHFLAGVARYGRLTPAESYWSHLQYWLRVQDAFVGFCKAIYFSNIVCVSACAHNYSVYVWPFFTIAMHHYIVAQPCILILIELENKCMCDKTSRSRLVYL